MSINTYLCSLASDLVLTDTEKNNISKSIETINKRLEYYFCDILEKKIFGSYVRGTILPRKVDSNSDIDLMIVFSNQENYKPQSFLNRLKRFAEHYYSSSEIYQSSPTIVLELNHIKFELTPAYCSNNIYYIPNGPSNWMYTNPDGFHEKLKKCNVVNNYKIKPVIRLIKYWNINKNNHKLASFMLENLIAEKLVYAYFTCTSYSDYVIECLEAIKYYTDIEKVDTAIDNIKRALEYEKNCMPYSAEIEIKKVFPEV